MKNVSQNFKNNIKKYGRQLDSRIKIGSVVIEKEDINSIAPSFHTSLFKTVMQGFEIDCNFIIPQGTIINIDIGVKFGRGQYEYIEYKDYKVKSCEKQEDTESYKIIAYDKMMDSMIDFDLDITNKISVRNYLVKVFKRLGWSTESIPATFINSTKLIDPTVHQGIGYTFRDVLDEIATITGSFIYIKDGIPTLGYITETNEKINEEYLSQDDVTIGEKYFINSLVFSRAEESDNIYRKDDNSIEEKGLHEFRIEDNQILSTNDRDIFIDELFNYLKTLEFYIYDVKSTGIMWLGICDMFTLVIHGSTYSTIMLNDEITVDQDIEERLYVDEPDETETDYKCADTTDKRINQAYILVNKQKREIYSKVSSVETTANAAKTTAEGAKTAADNANTTANEAKNTASTAQQTANSANNTANTAKQTAEQANSTAAEANTNANNALSGVNNITNTQGEAEGKSIHIEDSAEEPLVEISLHGETTQKTRSGKNKFNYKKLTPTFNIDGDGKEFTITAPNIETTIYEYTGFEIGKQYTLSGFYSSKSLNGVFRIKYSDGTYAAIKAIYDGSAVSKTKFSVTSTVNKTIASLQFILYGNIYDFTLYDFQVEEGPIATECEEYGAMPSPEFKSPIENIEGKNKLKNNYEEGYTTTINGVKFTVNKDKSVSIKGKATADAYFYLNSSTTASYTEKIKNGTYMLSGCNGGSNATYMLGIILNTQDSTGGKYITSRSGALKATISDGDNTYYSYILVKSGATVDTTIYPQLEHGPVATKYVPYNSLEVKVIGKNWFDKTKDFNSSNIAENLWTVTQIENGLRVKSNYNDGAPYVRYVITDLSNYVGKTIRMKARFTNSSTNKGSYRLVLCNANGYDAVARVFSDEANKEISFTPGTLEEGRKYLALDLYSNVSGTQSPTAYVDYTDIIITINDDDMTYEPYKSQTEYFPLEEGQKLMEGSYLADDGVHNNKKQITLDGVTSGLKVSAYYLYSNGLYYAVVEIKDFAKMSIDKLKCTHFVCSNAGVVKGNSYITNSGKSFVFVLNDQTFTTAAQVNNWLAEQYANGKPVIIEYDLAEPEIIPYTERQQKAWNRIEALMTYKNVTNITSDAYAKITYMRNNGLDVYETKQNAERKYTETSEKLAEQKITVDGVITQVSKVDSRTDELTGNAEKMNSTINTIEQTINGWSQELKNTGGNNLFYYSLEFWDNNNGLEEYSDTDIIQNSISQLGYILNNGSAKQALSVKNGFYTCSFNYKKLLELATCKVIVNGITYNLNETDWTEFEQAFEIKTNKLEIEFISDTDNSLYISDLMVNIGKTKLSWSQNANETRTDTVTIGKGIQVDSNAKNTYHRIDADGNRTYNKATGKVVNEATDKGTETEELVVRGQAKITGLLIQKAVDQVWINSLL